MTMTKKPVGVLKHPKTGNRLYPLYTKDEFEKIEHVAGYEKFPYKLRTLNNVSVYIPEIRSLADVERCKDLIIRALETHKKLKAYPVKQ